MVSERQPRSYAAAVVNGGSSGGVAPEFGADHAIPETPNGSHQGFNADESQNPFYLHITENPSTVLVSPVLTENNYRSWSRSMEIALEVKNKFGFVDGSIAVPDRSDPQFLQWRRCNKIVCSWILRSLSPAIAESVLYQEKARDIWKDLQARYSQSDPHKIAELQNQIYNNKQGNLSVNSYFTKCKSLWEQMKPLPICECNPRCSCDLVSKIRKEREDDCVIRFLDGLNEEYENLKSGLLVADPIPHFDKVLNTALKMERKLNGSASSNSNELMQANAAQITQQQNEDENSIIAATGFNNSNNNSAKKNFGNNAKTLAKCTFCGKTGHTIDNCYKKHGFPLGWVPGYKLKGKQGQNVQQSSNALIGQNGDIGLSNDQFQRLVSLLQNQTGQTSSSSVASVLNNASLRSDFKNTTENPNEGSTWHDGWFF